MSSPPTRQWQPFYVGWLIALIIILTCVAGEFLGIVPGSDKLWFALIGLLAVAAFFR
jgi:hypothetical protein